MKGYAGIYALYHGDSLYYTGLTGNLHGRIRWHLKDRHRGRWDHFVVFRIHRVRYLKDIETIVLSLTSPPGNKVHGKVPRDADLNRRLRQTLSEYKRRIKGYEKSFRS